MAALSFYVGQYFRRCICPQCRYGDKLRAATFTRQDTFDGSQRCQLCGEPIRGRQLTDPPPDDVSSR